MRRLIKERFECHDIWPDAAAAQMHERQGVQFMLTECASALCMARLMPLANGGASTRIKSSLVRVR